MPSWHPVAVMGLEPWLDASQEMWRVTSVEDWVEIRRLHHAEGMGIKAIARRLPVARNTVRDAVSMTACLASEFVSGSGPQSVST